MPRRKEILSQYWSTKNKKIVNMIKEGLNKLKWKVLGWLQMLKNP